MRRELIAGNWKMYKTTAEAVALVGEIGKGAAGAPSDVLVARNRSVNKEIIVCIQEALESRRVDPESFLARVEALHRQIQAPSLTDKMLRRARVEGRP